MEHLGPEHADLDEKTKHSNTPIVTGLIMKMEEVVDIARSFYCINNVLCR